MKIDELQAIYEEHDEEARDSQRKFSIVVSPQFKGNIDRV